MTALLLSNPAPTLQVCEVKYARVQGKDALVEHFRNSKFPSNDIDCLPLIFEKVELVRCSVTAGASLRV